jgi:hypothetical protein
MTDAAAAAAKLIDRMLAMLGTVQRDCHGEDFPRGKASPPRFAAGPAPVWGSRRSGRRRNSRGDHCGSVR